MGTTEDEAVVLEQENSAPAKRRSRLSARARAILAASANVPAKPQLEGDVIDLNDEEPKVAPLQQWLQKKFAGAKAKPMRKSPAKPKNYQQLKEKLENSLAEKRRRGMEERYEVFNADNEIAEAESADDEDEEEAEEILSDEDSEKEEEEGEEAEHLDECNDADVEDEADEMDADEVVAVDMHGADKDDVDRKSIVSQYSLYAQTLQSQKPRLSLDMDSDSGSPAVDKQPLEIESEQDSNIEEHHEGFTGSDSTSMANFGKTIYGSDMVLLNDDDSQTDGHSSSGANSDLLVLCSQRFPKPPQVPSGDPMTEVEARLKVTGGDGGWNDLVTQQEEAEDEEWDEIVPQQDPSQQPRDAQDGVDSLEAESRLLSERQNRGCATPTKQASGGQPAAQQETPNKAYLRQIYEAEEATRDSFYAPSDDDDAAKSKSVLPNSSRLHFGDDSSDDDSQPAAANTAMKASEPLPSNRELSITVSTNNHSAPIDNSGQAEESVPDTSHSGAPMHIDSDDEPEMADVPVRKRQHRILESDEEDDDHEVVKKRSKSSDEDSQQSPVAVSSTEPAADSAAVSRPEGVRAELEDSSDDESERPLPPPTNFADLDADLFTVEDEVEEVVAVRYEDEDTQAGVDDDQGSRDSGEAPKGGIQQLSRKDLFDDEASLSGDDVGSDNDEDGENMDEYEVEEGDDEELPEEDEIRNQLVKQFLRQQNNDDERRLMLLQEQFFADGDLAGPNVDRGFRFRLRDDDDNVDWAKLLGDVGDDGEKVGDEEHELDPEQQAKRVEMLQWKLKQAQKGSDKPLTNLFQDDGDDSLFNIGGKIVLEDKTTVESTSMKIRKDSLLAKATTLSAALKDGVPAPQDSRFHGLFTAQTKNA